MTRISLCAALLASLTTAALAGEVYGTIYQNEKPAPGLTVNLSCGAQPMPGQKQTNPDGTYRFFVRESGGCTLSVGGDRKATANVYSYDRPTAYDFNYDGNRLTPRNTR